MGPFHFNSGVPRANLEVLQRAGVAYRGSLADAYSKGGGRVSTRFESMINGVSFSDSKAAAATVDESAGNF
jgi:hypothetical protein